MHGCLSCRSLIAIRTTARAKLPPSSCTATSARSTFATALSASRRKYVFDLCVIGGGSGGLATAQEASRLGARVALFDYVKPSPRGTTWGLGGTCVNVGCVPKKLMHYAGGIGAVLRDDARKFGWQIGDRDPHHAWEDATQLVQNHVRSLNFSYRVGLPDLPEEDRGGGGVHYFNALAAFDSPESVTFETDDGVAFGEPKAAARLKATHFVVAVGGRPRIPDNVAGAHEHAVTSDDVWSLPTAPGRTLCVGGGYVALETAGFLTSFGAPTAVAMRSVALRGFDRQCATKIVATMAESGTEFITNDSPASIVKVKVKNNDNGNGGGQTGDDEDEQLHVTFAQSGATRTFDTVVYATGRSPDVAALGLDAAGVELNAASGKIEVDESDRTSSARIYAVGDVAEGRPELTPVAIKAGELLARRLFSASGTTSAPHARLMDYANVATAVFTPVEYGCVGLSEEAAIETYGEEDVETYIAEWSSLEAAAAHRPSRPHLSAEAIAAKAEAEKQNPYALPEELGPGCLSKLVCIKSERERVVGFHFVGPHAGEVTQGFALALKLGATKEDFDGTVGIHPTDAEAFVQMDVTRASGEDWVAAGGCGGGKCG